MDTQKQIAVHKWGFDGVQRGGILIKLTVLETRVRKLENGMAAGKVEVTRDIIKGGGDSYGLDLDAV